MLKNRLKLNHAKFEYFILQINVATQIEEIKTKLSNLKALMHELNVIVLNFEEAIQLDKLTKIVLETNEYATSLGMYLHSISQNEFIPLDNVLGIPVINLPLPDTKNYLAHIYNKTIICQEPVRSGIKVENDGDIIVTSFVSDNAEIIAGGNIHIYGEARGRLIAGSSGDKSARIFATRFNAELIAIGGIYRVIETLLPENILCRPVMVSLDKKEKLVILPMGQ